MPREISNAYLSRRPLVLGLAKVLFLSLAQLPLVQAAPTYLFHAKDEEEGKDPDDPGLWLYLGVAAALVLLGGAFAGLTIALMGQVGCFQVLLVQHTLTFDIG
jgi:metal transporter CNNM